MKNIIKHAFIFLLFSYSHSLVGQQGIEVSYNSVHSGSNISLGYIMPISQNFEFSLGVKYHINHSLRDQDGNLFVKTGYANQFINRFGAKTRITRKVNSIKYIGNLSFSLVSEYAYLQYRTLINHSDSGNSGLNLFREFNLGETPLNRIENNLVISKEIPLNELFSIVVAGGGGLAHLWGNQFYGGLTWEFSPYLSAGIKCSFSKA